MKRVLITLLILFGMITSQIFSVKSLETPYIKIGGLKNWKISCGIGMLLAESELEFFSCDNISKGLGVSIGIGISNTFVNGKLGILEARNKQIEAYLGYSVNYSFFMSTRIKSVVLNKFSIFAEVGMFGDTQKKGSISIIIGLRYDFKEALRF